MRRGYATGMTPLRPITPSLAPARLVAEAVLHAPPAGSLGWGARMLVVAVVSLGLWTLILALAGLIA